MAQDARVEVGAKCAALRDVQQVVGELQRALRRGGRRECFAEQRVQRGVRGEVGGSGAGGDHAGLHDLQLREHLVVQLRAQRRADERLAVYVAARGIPKLGA